MLISVELTTEKEGGILEKNPIFRKRCFVKKSIYKGDIINFSFTLNSSNSFNKYWLFICRS